MGDVAAVRPLVTPDVTIVVVTPDGHSAARGVEAVTAYARERSGTVARDVRVEVQDVRTSDGELVVVFDAASADAAGLPSRRLGVWTFREGLIASVRLSGVPAGPDAPLQPSVD